MLKAGILTYHRSVNEGSVMQTYCLQKLLQSLKPEAHIEIIDFRSLKVEKREFFKCIKRQFPFIDFWQWSKLLRLRSFIRNYTKISLKTCLTDDLKKTSRFISGQNYGIIVAGSDTVWRLKSNKKSSIVPSIYYLPDIYVPRKIAFAVSFDMTDKAALNSISTKSRMYDFIQDFDFISFRDAMSRKYLLKFGIDNKKLFYMPDPTILWDFSSQVETPNDFPNDQPLAGISVPDKSIRKIVTNKLRERGYRVINLLGSAVSDQMTVPKKYSLQKRLGIYALLDLLVTDRFHGSIFTFKLGNAPVIFLESADKYPDGTISKGRDLFQRLGIEWSVYRYKKEGFDSRIIDKIMNGWINIAPNIKNELNLLKQNAVPLLNRIF